MKPPPFDYHAPRILDEALALLARHGDDAKLLAGGQSLVPLLNMRLARPAALVDLNRIPSLFEVERHDGELRLGAMVRHLTLERDPLIRTAAPLLAEAAGLIGHVQIRTRGTLGGSLAHADPAAELPTAISALDARLVVRSASGAARMLSPGEFFTGPLTTSMAPDEALVEVRVPVMTPRTGCAFAELTRRHGDFALVGAAALVRFGGGGRVKLARLVLCGVGGVPWRSPVAEGVLVGTGGTAHDLEAVAEAVRATVEPDGDLQLSAASRRDVAGVIAARALGTALERARAAGA